MACAVASVAIVVWSPAQDGDPAARAAMLRASVILKIAPYVKVDPAPAGPPPAEYRIAVVGTDATAAAILANLPGKKVDGAVVTVVAVDPKDAATGKLAEKYDLLYVAESIDAAAARRVVDAHAKHPVVTVCERAGFARAGGGVQLFVQDNGIRFEVNAEALKDRGLRASPQLLKLSRKGPE